MDEIIKNVKKACRARSDEMILKCEERIYHILKQNSLKLSNIKSEIKQQRNTQNFNRNLSIEGEYLFISSLLNTSSLQLNTKCYNT